MKLENQVCSLELAKKLKELGVKQESYFYWNSWERTKCDIPACNCGNAHCVWSVDTGPGFYQSFSAFTVAELGEMLWRANEKYPNSFIKVYGDVFNFPGTGMIGTLGVINLMYKPDMAAKMLIHLAEKGLIDQIDTLKH